MSKTKEKILKDFTFGIYEDEECAKIIQQIDSNSEKATITFKDKLNHTQTNGIKYVYLLKIKKKST